MPKQQLGLGGAIAIGLASMLGAGVFVVFASAYQISSGLIFWSIGLAAVVASLNSAAIFQLARQIERPGGVYTYSRKYLNNNFSFLSGFAFVFGKVASIAAIALVFQKYVLPGQPFWPSALAIVTLTVINILGINRTALVAALISAVTILYFVSVSLLGFAAPQGLLSSALEQSPTNPLEAVLVGAGVVFFAFAGYARVATLGNEVRDAKRNIPIAIVVSMVSVALLYFALAWILLNNIGPELVKTQTPVALLFEELTGNAWLTPLVAAIASLGSMLALLAGVSRTAATMAEDDELPKVFELRNRFGSPWVAEVIIAAGAIGLSAIGEIVWVIGFSSFSVLFYYAVGQLSASKQPSTERTMPKLLNYLGAVICVVLALAFGIETFLISTGILLTAWLLRHLWQRAKTK